MSQQAAFEWADEPREVDPKRKTNFERAVRAIVDGFDLRVADYTHEIVVCDAGPGFQRVLVAFGVVADVVLAARYMGHAEKVAAAFERWADAMDAERNEQYRKDLGEYDAPDWRPEELVPEDFYAA